MYHVPKRNLVIIQQRAQAATKALEIKPSKKDEPEPENYFSKIRQDVMDNRQQVEKDIQAGKTSGEGRDKDIPAKKGKKPRKGN